MMLFKRGNNVMKTIKCLMDHMYWADKRILEALEKSNMQNMQRLKLARHVAVAEQVWLSRLQGKGGAQFSLWEKAESLRENQSMFEEKAKQYRPYYEAVE